MRGTGAPEKVQFWPNSGLGCEQIKDIPAPKQQCKIRCALEGLTIFEVADEHFPWSHGLRGKVNVEAP
jgi:hypothetical protein